MLPASQSTCLSVLIEQHGSQLAARLDAELAVGRSDGQEPALPTPRPNGVMASAL